MAEAKIRLAIDGVQPVMSGLKQVGDKVRDLSGSITSLTALGGSLSVGAFAAMVKSAIDTADNLNDLSKSTGIAVDNLAGLKMAAQQSGTELEGVAKAVNKLSVNIAKDSEKFAKLGVTAKDPIEALKQLADVFVSIEDPQLRAAVGSEALGKSWESVAPLLAEGGQKIGEMVDKGKRLSNVTQEAAEQADKFNDQLVELRTAADGLAMKVGSDLLPALTEVTGAVKTAYEESGALKALWVALGGLGTALFTDDFASTKVKIQNVQNEIANLEDRKKQLVGAGYLQQWLFGTEGEIETKIASLKTELAGLQKSLQPPEKPQVDPEIARIEARAKAEAEARARKFIADKAASEHAAKEFEAMVKHSKQYIESLELETKKVGLSADQVKMLAAAQEAAKAPTADLAKRIMEQALALDIKTKAHEASMEAERRANEIADRMAKDADSIWEQVRALEVENETYGMIESSVTELAIAQVESARQAFDLTEREVAALDSKLAALKRLQQQQRIGESREATRRAADASYQEWSRMHEDLSRSLTDNIMRGGKNALDYIKDYARTLVLQPIVKMIADPLASMVTGAFGGSGGAGAGSSGSILGNLGSIFNAPVGGQLAQYIQSGMNFFNGSGGMVSQGPIEVSSLAQNLGQVGGLIGSTIAGYNLSRLISNGYQVNPTINKIAALGGPIGGVIGGLVNRAFGRRPRVNGLGGFQGNFSDDGFTDGQTFQRWSQAGGWFRSDREGTDYGALDTEFAQSLTRTYQSLRDANTQYAQALGLTTDAVRGYAKEFILALTGDDAQDAELLATEFAKINDELADRLLPNFAQFAREGETASAVLQRLAVDYQAVDASLAMLSRTFGEVGIASAEARSRLVELAGGVDALMGGTTFFANTFLTEAERIEPTIQMVTSRMAELGYASVDTKDEFKDLVLGLIDGGQLATEEGAALYTQLLQLAPAFSTVADYHQRMADEAIANAERQATETARIQEETVRAAEEAARATQEAADEAARATQQAAEDAARMAQEAAQLALDNAMSVVDRAFSAVQRAVKAERDTITAAHKETMDALNGRVKTVNESIGKLSSLSNSLRNAVERMRLPNQDRTARAEAQAQISTALAIARASGVLPDADALAGALQVVSQPSEQFYATFADYQRDTARTANEIRELSRLTDMQASVEEQTLATLNEQLATAEQGYADEMVRLDGQLALAQSQLDALHGIDASIKTIPDAIAQLRLAIGTAAQAQATVAAGNNSTASVVTGMFNTILGRDPRAEGAAFWTRAFVDNPQSMEEHTRDFIEAAVRTGGTDAARAIAYARANGIPGFASGGDFSGGTALVGERGPELINTGPARIFNAAQTANMLRGDDSELLGEVRRLADQVARLSAAAERTERNTASMKDGVKRSTDVLEGVARGEMTFTTEAAA
ncbi:MAG TPA: hypothetical protein VGE12_18640 [Noviherbaspirillum sp.]